MPATLTQPGFDQSSFDAFLHARNEPTWLTDQRREAWQSFTNQAKAQATAMQAQRAAVTATQTAPDRLAQRAAFAKQRAANLETMSGAVKALYEALTPEQKAIADQRMAFGGGMGGPGGRGGPGRMGGPGGWR